MYIKDIKESLLNAFNAETGLSLKIDEVTFRNPRLWLQAGCNTKVTVSAKETSDYARGSVDILYNRYPVSDALKDILLDGEPGRYQTAIDVLRYLREVQNVSAYEEDFEAAIYGPADLEVVLTPTSDALVWLPPDPVTLRYSSE